MFNLSCFQIAIIIVYLKMTNLQGRVDDNIDTIKKRLKVFSALNLPVVKYYLERGKLYKVCYWLSFQLKSFYCWCVAAIE